MQRTQSRTDGRTDRLTDKVITIKTKSEVKVKVTATRKSYVTTRHLKMHSHTKLGIPTLKNIGDMHRTRSGTDGRTVQLLYASQSLTRISFKSKPAPLFIFFKSVLAYLQII